MLRLGAYIVNACKEADLKKELALVANATQTFVDSKEEMVQIVYEVLAV